MTPRRLENLAVYRKQQVIRILGENVEGRYMDNTASAPPSLPPPQPKPLFQRSPVIASSNPAYNSSICDKNLRMGEGERLDIRATGSNPASISGILRRRWRQQHNLRERDRRREESILYEMIRTCLSEEHIRLHLPGVNKTPENLSYHQILRISLEMLKNEEREMDLFNHHKMVVQTLEQECLKRGIPLPEDRPLVIPPMEKHQRYAKIVIEALRMDRCRMHRNAYGDGEELPTSREVALEIDKRLRESDRSFIRESKRRFSDYDNRPSKRHHPSPSNFPTPHLSPRREVTNEENDSLFANREPPHRTKGTSSDIQIRPQPTSVDTVCSSPELNLLSSHTSATQHLDHHTQEESKDEGVADAAASNSVFNLPLLSPSAGVNLGIETEPLFHLLSSTEIDVNHVDT